MKKGEIVTTIRNVILLVTLLASFFGTMLKNMNITIPEDIFSLDSHPLFLFLVALFFLPPILCGEVGLFSLPRYMVLNRRPWKRKLLVLHSIRLGISLVAIVTMVVFAVRLSPVYLPGIAYAAAAASAIFGLVLRRKS